MPASARAALRPLVIIALLSLVLPATDSRGQVYTLTSPDSSLTATVGRANGAIYYSLNRGSETLIGNSRLGLILDSGGVNEDLGASDVSLTLSASGVSSVNRTYDSIGWHPTAVDHYNAQTFSIAKPTLGAASSSAVEMRLFNDGLAFRYQLPSAGGVTRLVKGEATNWQLPSTASGWYQSGANADYANLWVKTTVTGGASLDAAARILGPVVIDYGAAAANRYAAITESDYWGYSGMSYAGSGGGTSTIKAAFIRDTGGWSVPAGSFSPWRTIMASPSLNGLVNNDIINNVARAPDPALFPQGVKTSWITPGRSLWSFLDTNQAARTPENMRLYVDKAQELGFEYVTVDSGWKTWSDPDAGKNEFGVMGDLVAYAHARGVKIIAWKDSHDFYSGDLVTGDFDSAAMTAFLQQLHDVGVDGVKMDFLRRTGHLVGEYQRLLNFMKTGYEQAALRQMVVDFHGAPKTAGQAISFPNSLTTEHLRGHEVAANSPHDAALPFTTLLAGAADYTPGVFSSDAVPGARGTRSWPHEMAMGVVITSPINHWASGPQTIDNSMPGGSLMRKVFQNIPATWDETEALEISEIGSLAAMARRSGNRWFLALVSGDATNPITRDNIDLSFLGDGQYDAIFLSDDPSSAAAWNTGQFFTVTRTFDLDITMRPAGGFVAMFTPVPEPAAIGVLALAAACLLPARRPRIARGSRQ